MSEWVKYALKDLVDLKQGFALNKKSDHYLSGDNTGLPLLKISDLINGTETLFVKVSIPKQFLVYPNEIIYSRTGQVGLAFMGKTGVIYNNCFKVIPNEKVYAEFLYQWLNNPITRETIQSLATGAAQPDLNHDAFKSVKILLPPLPTQRRIASILSAYDDLIENNLKRIKLLEESLQIIQNKLSTETDSNPSLIYPEIADFEKGFEPGSNSYVEEYSNGLIPFIRVGDLNSRESKLYINSELKGIKMSQSDDILISMDGSIGIVSVGINGAYSSGIRKVALKNRLLKGLIYAFLKSPTGQSQIMTFAKGSTILHASSCIPKLKVIIPNEIKYKNEFELANSCLDQIIKLISQNKILKESRDILLPRLMSGKINVE